MLVHQCHPSSGQTISNARPSVGTEQHHHQCSSLTATKGTGQHHCSSLTFSHHHFLSSPQHSVGKNYSPTITDARFLYCHPGRTAPSQPPPTLVPRCHPSQHRHQHLSLHAYRGTGQHHFSRYSSLTVTQGTGQHHCPSLTTSTPSHPHSTANRCKYPHPRIHHLPNRPKRAFSMPRICLQLKQS
jgi:hypothetical protein